MKRSAAKIAFQKAGLGHGFLPRICIRKESEEKSLVERSVEDPRPPESFRLAWPKENGEALTW
ncbi:MAG TPA: LysR substrate-binding domain-containing protein [Casimicrobiaceae bacterium]|nr:LysR substrate-binding domain-containing protein [Casimicrobiaceae bacterium]